MGTFILRWFLSRTVRQAVDMCRQVRKFIQAQCDLLPPEKIQEISKAARELKGAIMAGEKLDDIRARMKNLEKVANDNLLPYPHGSIRENVEVFLVTGAVVLALRTFFFQPMAIPSGSAQPTLWGITSENLQRKPDARIPRGFERLFQACWMGAHYYYQVAENDGELRIGPRRGEIIVFESTGIPGIIQNTQDIKRLIALGGEHVRIGNDRHVIVNGVRLDASTPFFENVYGFDPKQPPIADHFSGHVNGSVHPGLAALFPNEQAEFVVRPHYCLAFGDNTMNSNDGRNWGDFPEEKIIGKASFVFWPIGGGDHGRSRFGWGFR